MGTVSFKEFLNKPPKNKMYLADTSFLINSIDTNSKEYEIRNKLSGKVGFGYNVVVKKELMHFLRRALFREEMFVKKNTPLHKRLYTLWDMHESSGDPLKELCNEGYAELFRIAFGNNGETLKASLETVLNGCSYVDGKNNKNAKNWDNVFSIMSMYGLDSSDAMILNFAIGDSTFAGLITSDADFRVCGDMDKSANFDIVLPVGAKNRPSVKSWKP